MAATRHTPKSNRTKIIATIGPACKAVSVLRGMIQSGLAGARLNFSHGLAENNLELLDNIRAAARAEKRTIAIIQDLQGSKLRLGQLPPEGLQLLENSMANFRVGLKESDQGVLPVPYKYLARDVRRGDRILLNDGMIELEVAAIEGKTIITKVLVGGTVLSWQGISVPNRKLTLEAITAKDEADLALGIENNVDFVTLSFASTAADVRLLKKKISHLLPADTASPQVIVKIEKYEAINNLDEIIAEADGIMVARGDLGLNTSIGQVPIIQKEIIAKCLVAGKPVIVATHMLSSMTLKPRPTRAEASDVANAVIDHTDAVMLSEETAVGYYPVRAVQTMSDIIAAVEESSLDDMLVDNKSRGEPPQLAIAAAASRLSRQIDAKAILVTTKSGFSARAIARFRPQVPIYAATEDTSVQRQLNLSWGISTLPVTDEYDRPDKMVESAVAVLRHDYGIKKGDLLVVLSGLKRSRDKYESIVRVIEV